MTAQCRRPCARELANRHGIGGNGFSSATGKPLFWEQNGSLVEGSRIWDGFRRRGGTVGQLFIQQSLRPDCDVLYSPAPIHKHHGGMILDCIGRPEAMHQRLCRELGTFPLHSYWGPWPPCVRPAGSSRPVGKRDGE
jgi:hypothetical protein